MAAGTNWGSMRHEGRGVGMKVGRTAFTCSPVFLSLHPQCTVHCLAQVEPIYEGIGGWWYGIMF